MDKSIYIIVANEEEKVKECIALTDRETALRVFDILKRNWGNENVAFISRAIDDIPHNISTALYQIKWIGT